MSDLCDDLDGQADAMADEFTAHFLPLAETEVQRAILARCRTEYRDAYLTYRRADCAVRGSSVGGFVAGRSGRTASMQRQHERAVDKQHTIWERWHETAPKIYRRTEIELRDAETPEQRTIRVSRELIRRAEVDLLTVEDIDRGLMPGYDRQSFVAGFTNHLHRTAKHPDNVGAVRECLWYILRTGTMTTTKPFLSKRNKVWAYLPEDERP